MATVSFTLPAQVADFLSLNVPGFAGALGGGSTLSLQVPALPAQVVAGLNEAGFGVGPAAASSGGGAPAAGAPAAASNAAGGPIGLAAFAPAGLAPQGDALNDPNLAGAVAFAQGLGQQANSFFQQVVADHGSVTAADAASFAAHQNQAIQDWIFGGS